MPGWRNWQTRQTQNLVLARESEFDPRSGHHFPLNFRCLEFSMNDVWTQGASEVYNLNMKAGHGPKPFKRNERHF